LLALSDGECQPLPGHSTTEFRIVKGFGTLFTGVPGADGVATRSKIGRFVPITTHIMRTIGFRSNILFAIAAAIGVVAALGRPWYAPAVKGDEDAQMESLLSGIGRAFTESDGRTGWDSFTQADTLIVGLTVTTVVLLVLAMIPAVQLHVQALARWTGIATLGVVLVKFFDEPGANAAMEPRYGLLVAILAAAVLVASAMTVAAAPSRRKHEVRTYVAPPAPEHAPESTWGPTQF
jgi:preprotein translocase subunit Sec61beta